MPATVDPRAEAAELARDLRQAAAADIYTDAPECGDAVAEASATMEAAARFLDASMPARGEPGASWMNSCRASWANTALSAFVVECGGDDDETILGDLLADIRHLADAQSWDVEALWSRARSAHAEEIAQDGGRASVDFGDPDAMAKMRMAELQSARDLYVLGHPNGHEEPDPEGWAREYPDDAAELDQLEAGMVERTEPND